MLEELRIPAGIKGGGFSRGGTSRIISQGKTTRIISRGGTTRIISRMRATGIISRMRTTGILSRGGTTGRRGFGGKGRGRTLSLPSIFQINPIHLGEPSAGREEILPQISHHQVDGAHGITHADIAAAAVLPRVEREAGVVVVMKGAECLVPLHLYPHLFRNPLYRQVAELLNFIFLHKISLLAFSSNPTPIRYHFRHQSVSSRLSGHCSERFHRSSNSRSHR